VSLVLASTLDGALDALSADPALRPIAAGVGVMLARALGHPVGTHWLGVARLPELRERSRPGDGIARIGAAVTLEDLARGIAPPAGLLEAAARSSANSGIRTVATLGGNVVAGRAWSDPVAALVALGAEAEIVATGGGRRIPVEALAASGLQPGELVRCFLVPSANAWGWQRLTIRGAMDSSVASVAVAVGDRPGVAVTFVSDRVVRLPTVEGLLAAGTGADSEDASVREAASEDLADLTIRGSDRASERYLRRVLPVLVARAVAEAVARREASHG
jgi:CO/xanthine dehydrogenase FAD-binding subunit